MKLKAHQRREGAGTSKETTARHVPKPSESHEHTDARQTQGHAALSDSNAHNQWKRKSC